MASAVECVIECQICTLTFTEPLSLPCEHSFCKSCVDKITKSGNVKCPVCSRITPRKDIKPDFRLVQFLDALAKKVQELTKAKPSVVEFDKILCELCEDKGLSHHCKNCDKWICTNCRKVHANISDSKYHKIVSFKENNSELVSRLSDVIQSLRGKLQLNQSHVASLDKRMLDNETLEEQTVSSSKGIREEFISVINAFFDNIDSEIHKIVNAERGALLKQRVKYEQEIEALYNKIKQLDKFIEQKSVELLRNGAILLKDSHEYLQKPQQPPAHDIKPVSMVLVKLADLDLNKNVVLNKTSIPRQNKEHVQQTSVPSTVSLPIQPQLESATRGVLTLQKDIDVPDTPSSIRVIDGLLYCCHGGGVTVYNNQLQMISSMIMDEENYFTDIASMPNGEFVVSGGHGLKVYNKSGTRLRVINEIDIGCLQLHSGKLYAVECRTHTIHVYNPAGWTKEGSITVPCKCNFRYVIVTMSVSDDGIRVCCNKSNKVLTMSLRGDIQREFRYQVQGTDQCKLTCLCETESSDMLIADKNYKRLHHLDTSGKWHVLKFQQALNGYPLSAALWDGRLYVCTKNSLFISGGKLSLHSM